MEKFLYLFFYCATPPFSHRLIIGHREGTIMVGQASVWEDVASYSMNLLAAQISQPLCVFPSAGRIINMNLAFSKMFYADEALLSQENFYTLFDIWECDFIALNKGKSISLYDREMVLFNDTRCPVDAVIGCLKESSGVELGIFYVLVTDLSMRQEHELLTRRMHMMTKQRAISAELHDRIAQHLTLLKMRHAELKLSVTSKESYQDCEKIIDICLNEVRLVISKLRNGNDLNQDTVMENHYDLISFARNMLGLKVHTRDLNYFSFMDSYHYRAACFVLREALTNVWKHAETKEVWITLVKKESGFKLKVRDKGCGISKEKPSGLGLQILQERLSRQKIVFDVNSKIGEGTSVVVELKKAA